MFRLRLKRLDFISAVDAGAQGPIANVALIKRAPKGDSIEATCRVIKTDESLGLVFGWALASTLDGGVTPHVDLQKDAIVGDDELIRVAAEFMETSAASDVMHDSNPDGKIVFAMPLTKAVNEALGISSDTHGLAIAMKPSPETFKRFVSGELNAFSIGGIGEREPLHAGPTSKKKTTKRGLLTTPNEGHAHLLDDGDGAGSGYTSMECMGEGMDATYHSHPWFRNDDGDVVIGMSAGHAHELHDPTQSVDEMAVAQRAPQRNSTRKTAPRTVATTETKPMNVAKMLTAILAMTPSQQAYVSKLAPDEVEPFFAKGAAERDAIFKSAEAADEVVFKGEVTGLEVRKSEGAMALKLAKLAETNAATIAKQQTEIEKRDAEIEKGVIEGIAKSHLGSVAGDLDVHAYIVKSIRKGGGDTTMVEKALTTLKSINDFAKSKSRPAGGNGAEVSVDDPADKLDALAKKYAKDNNVPFGKAYVAVLETDEGRDLYASQPKPSAQV